MTTKSTHERESLRLSNAPRERRIVAARIARDKAIDDARYLLRGAGYHVIQGGVDLDVGAISSVLGDWHHSEVRAIADSIIADVRIERGIDPMPRWCAGRACELRGASENAVREWVTERADSDTDNHEHVIYTYQAKLLLVASDNESAADDEYGPGKYTVEQRACMALRADVWEVLNAREDEWLTCDEPDEDPDPSDDEIDLAQGLPFDDTSEAARGPSDGEIESHSGHGGVCGLVACTIAHERESDIAADIRARSDQDQRELHDYGSIAPEDADATAVRAEISARQRGRDDTREREHAEIVRAREHAEDE